MNLKNQSSLLSIIVPCLNEEKNIESFIREISNLNLDREVEYIFVDDGSKDSTWDMIINAQSRFNKLNINAIKFTRNFGKESALESGLLNSKGDLILTIDCDLQHPIHLIPMMIGKLENNQDVYIINAVKKNRQKEGLFKKIFSSFYYWIFKISTGINLKNHSDFKLIERKVLEEYLNLKERNKFYRGLTNWLGFNSINIEFDPLNRVNDAGSWSIKALFNYAKGSILSFSYLPLKFITWLGLGCFIFSVILTIHTLIKKINGSSAEGFPTVILLILGIGSLILFSLGIIGEYLSEIYKEIKHRPTFVINKKSMKGDK